MNTTTYATVEDRAEALNVWHLVDASEHRLGRMAAGIAEILMGKHKPLYTPHINVGDGVVVINGTQVQTTGEKAQRRTYHYYTGFAGGLRKRLLGEYREENPEEMIKLAVRRMLPKNRIGKQMLKRLKVYRGNEHPHAAQNPQPLKLGR